LLHVYWKLCVISIKVGDLVEYAGKPKHAKGRLRGHGVVGRWHANASVGL